MASTPSRFVWTLDQVHPLVCLACRSPSSALDWAPRELQGQHSPPCCQFLPLRNKAMRDISDWTTNFRYSINLISFSATHHSRSSQPRCSLRWPLHSVTCSSSEIALCRDFGIRCRVLFDFGMVRLYRRTSRFRLKLCTLGAFSGNMKEGMAVRHTSLSTLTAQTCRSKQLQRCPKASPCCPCGYFLDLLSQSVPAKHDAECVCLVS